MLEKLYKYRDELIKQEIDGYNEEYKNSKWYREPTLKEIVGDSLYPDYISFEKALKKGDKDEIKSFIAPFEQSAHNYGASWWDDDLGCERTGYEFETEFYVTLRNIAAGIIGLATKDVSEFWEGFGTC